MQEERLSLSAAGSQEDPLILSGIRPVAAGVKRLIFQHPDHPDLLVKVLRPEFVQKRFGPTGAFHNRHRRCRHYNYFLRELREYLVACARSADSLSVLPEVVGLVHTDLGLGLVVKKVCGPDGGLAPTLETLAASGGMDDRRLALLDALEEAVVASDIVIDDLHLGNVVLAQEPPGAERFALIDGMGSSTVIQLKAFAPLFSRWSKRRKFRKLRALLAEAIYSASSSER